MARWVVREGRGTVAIGILTVAFVIGRMTDLNSLVRDPGYRPTFTTAQFLETSRHFLGDLFSEGQDWTNGAVFALWAGLGLLAWLSRSRVLRFAWFFLMLAPLPLAFVFPARRFPILRRLLRLGSLRRSGIGEVGQAPDVRPFPFSGFSLLTIVSPQRISIRRILQSVPMGTNAPYWGLC